MQELPVKERDIKNDGDILVYNTQIKKTSGSFGSFVSRVEQHIYNIKGRQMMFTMFQYGQVISRHKFLTEDDKINHLNFPLM